MNIYLKWISIDSLKFQDISIFDLEIFQEENDFAKARLIIDALCLLPPGGTVGILVKEDETLLFKGQLLGSPIQIEGSFAEIELIAIPIDFKEKNAVLQKASRVHPYWNALWIKDEKRSDFEEIQDVRAASLYCDRCTGDLSWSDWFQGKQHLHLLHNFLQDRLSVKVLKPPFTSCTVKVHAHWVQSETGISNLSPSIRRAFPHFKVSTYTHQSLSTKWPQAGYRIGKSGLWVIKSELKPMFPFGAFYRRYSSPVLLEEEGKVPTPYRLKRHWFEPILWVGWSYQQKRTETLTLTLFHAVHSFFPIKEEEKILEFTLQNINPDPKAYSWMPDAYYREGSKVIFHNCIYQCHTPHTSGLSFEESQKFWNFKRLFHTALGNPARNSFFSTDQGYKAAEHAMERAKRELAKSARCIEVSFEGPWESLEGVTVDTSIFLSDPRLPGGELMGKVVKYSLLAKGETGERFAKVTLLCSVGTDQVERRDVTATPSYSLDGYCEDGYQIHENFCCQTPSGLVYFRYDDQAPLMPFHQGSLLRGIELMNGPQKQEVELLKQTYKTPLELKKVLSQNSTRLRLFFKDLRTKERLNHLISVKMAGPWSAPKHITIL